MTSTRFKPGERPVGRTKGTPNKRTLQVAELLESIGCDPLKLLGLYAIGDVVALKLATKEELKENPKIADRLIPTEHRIRCASELAQYIAPKRKAVEHSGGAGVVPGGILVTPGIIDPAAWQAAAAATTKKT